VWEWRSAMGAPTRLLQPFVVQIKASSQEYG